MTERHGEVYMLAQRVSKLETSQEHTAVAIEGLTKAVRELADVMNKSKGAAGVLLWLAGGGGFAGAVALLKQFLNN